MGDLKVCVDYYIRRYSTKVGGCYCRTHLNGIKYKGRNYISLNRDGYNCHTYLNYPFSPTFSGDLTINKVSENSKIFKWEI